MKNMLMQWFRRLVLRAGAVRQNRIMASLYFPWQRFAEPRTYYVQNSGPLRQEPVKGGLPIPPLPLRIGYGETDEKYLARVEYTATRLRGIFQEHGFKFAEHDRLLEWGCAAGRVLRHFAGEAGACECWGVDAVEEAIAWNKENLSPPFHFLTCSALPYLPFPDGYFSCIYGISVFTHITHLRDAWLMEFRRLLRPGGIAVFTIHDENTVAHFQQHGRPDWLPANLRLEDIAKNDLTVITGETTNHSYVFSTTDHIRREWGRYFTVAEIRPYTEGYQTAVILRKP